jgi:hypothetical protein
MDLALQSSLIAPCGGTEINRFGETIDIKETAFDAKTNPIYETFRIAGCWHLTPILFESKSEV